MRIMALILAVHAAVSGRIPSLVVAWSSVAGALGLLMHQGVNVAIPFITELVSGPHFTTVLGYGATAIFVFASARYGGEVDRYLRATPAGDVAPLASLQHYGNHGRETRRGRRGEEQGSGTREAGVVSQQ